MIFKIENCPAFKKKEYIFKNGINFYLTNEKNIQEHILRCLNNTSENGQRFFIDGLIVNYKFLKKRIYYVNLREKKLFLRNMKFKNLIRTDSKIIKKLDIESEVFELRFKQLLHRSYICSAAIGINKGKTILIFPWIIAKECSVQSYRIKKLFEYSKQNDLIIIIPTDSIEIFKKTIFNGTEYSMFE